MSTVDDQQGVTLADAREAIERLSAAGITTAEARASIEANMSAFREAMMGDREPT